MKYGDLLNHNADDSIFVCSQVDLRGFGMEVEVAEFDQQWQRVAGQTFRMDNTVFVPHDFAVSENYYVFWQSAAGLDLVGLYHFCTYLCLHAPLSVCILCSGWTTGSSVPHDFAVSQKY